MLTGNHLDNTDEHSFIMYMNTVTVQFIEQSPLLSAFPFPIPFCSPFVSLYLLGTLLAVIGSCPPRSQVARKLISPFPSPNPYTPHSKIPTPWGFPDPNIHLTKTTSRIWVTRSSTRRNSHYCPWWSSPIGGHWWRKKHQLDQYW
jgi:hypothetical protein